MGTFKEHLICATWHWKMGKNEINNFWQIFELVPHIFLFCWKSMSQHFSCWVVLEQAGISQRGKRGPGAQRRSCKKQARMKIWCYLLHPNLTVDPKLHPGPLTQLMPLGHCHSVAIGWLGVRLDQNQTKKRLQNQTIISDFKPSLKRDQL